MFAGMPSPELIPATSCPEQRIWRAVLLQILDDAQALRQQRFTQKTPRCHALDAWQMLIGDSVDFRKICELAEVEGEQLRKTFAPPSDG